MSKQFKPNFWKPSPAEGLEFDEVRKKVVADGKEIEAVVKVFRSVIFTNGPQIRPFGHAPIDEFGTSLSVEGVIMRTKTVV